MTRQASRQRITGETGVEVRIDLDRAFYSVSTRIGFFDHMLELLARHGGIGLEIEASGDLATGSHHTVEDVGIVIGQALSEALGDRAGIRRYGSALVPMDESLAECAIDVSGRSHFTFRAELPKVVVGEFEAELTEEFFRALAGQAGLTVHLEVRTGTNVHHMIEACFKAFARALGEAIAIDPGEAGIPSTKGSLSD